MRVECKNNRDTSNNRDKLNHLNIIQKIPEHHNWKARHQGSTKNRLVGHCARTQGSSNVKVQNVYHGI